MSTISSAAEAAARAAAEAARRALEAAQRRAAEAARRTAEAEARRAAQTAAQNAARTAAQSATQAVAQNTTRSNAAISRPPVADRFDAGVSSGGGGAHSAERLGAQAPLPATVTTDLSNQSLNSVTATSLLTENVHDAAENCLDASIERAASTGGEVILLDPAEDSPGTSNAGHAIVRNEEGYWDPATPDVTYETFEDWQNAGSTPNGSVYELTELGADPATGAPVGIDGRALYEVTTTEDPTTRAAKLDELSRELGVPPSFFGGQYANGGSITVPADAERLRFPADPEGVERVNVADLEEPLRSQVLTVNTIQENTGAGSGIDTVSQDGNLYVAVDAGGQLVDIENGQATVFQTGTVNTLSVFANVDMSDPSAVASAYGDALRLTRGDSVQPLATSEPLTAEQVQAYQEMGYTVAVLDPSNGRSAVRPPEATDADIANIGAAPGAEPVYVLVGGPDIPGIGELPPERVVEIQQQVAQVREDTNGRLFSYSQIYGQEFGLNDQSSPAEWAVYAQAIVQNLPPPAGSSDSEGANPLLVMANEVEAIGGPNGDQARLAVAGVLAQEALSPQGLPENSDLGLVAATAFRLVSTPQDATRFLEALGPEGATALLDRVGLDFGEGTTASTVGSDNANLLYRGLGDFVGLLRDQPPSPARDAFNLALLGPDYRWTADGGVGTNEIYQGAIEAWAGRLEAMPPGPERTEAAMAAFNGAPPELWEVEGFAETMASSVAPAMYPDDPALQAELQAELASATSAAEFLAPIARLEPQDGIPNVGQANFLFGAVQNATPEMWEDPSFRAQMGTGLANVFSMGDPAVMAEQGERLSALLANPEMGEILAGVSPQDREQILVAVLNTPGLTSGLLDEHHGNLGTALTQAQYTGFTDAVTGDLLDGTPRLGPDGQPLLSDQPLPPLPDVDLANHPNIAALPQPLTTQAIQQAVASGQLTGADAAAYLRAVAEVTTPVATADMEAFGASELLTNVIGFLQDFNPLNDPNPIRYSNADHMAQAQQGALFALADQLEQSDDPAFIAQALGAGIAVDAAYWGSMEPFGQALQAIEADVQRNRVVTMVAVGTVASILAPMGIAAGLPAMGSTGTVLGMTVTGSPFLSAALPAGATTVLSTTMNAAMQYESTGTVSWGNAILGGAADGLTSMFGGLVAARGMQQGWGLTRTMVTSGAVDAAGGFGSYVLGTPGALEAIMNGDTEHLYAALGQAGFSFALSAGVNGVTYRVNMGDAPPLGRSVNHGENQTYMGDLLDPANPSGIFGAGVDRPQVFGMDGQPLTASTIQGRDYESYFAVYRNPTTGEVRVQEIARSRPGDPLQLAAFDTVQGIRRNNPAEGWEPVGGFHNHPGQPGVASPEDLAMEPIFRGEFGEGFSSYALGADGTANPFHNTGQQPLTLREAYDSGYPVPGLRNAPGELRVYQTRALEAAGIDPSSVNVRTGLNGQPVFVDPAGRSFIYDGPNGLREVPASFLADASRPVPANLDPASLEQAGLPDVDPANLRVFQEVDGGSVLVDQSTGALYLMRENGEVAEFYVHVTTRSSLPNMQANGLTPYGEIEPNLTSGTYNGPVNEDGYAPGIWTVGSHDFPDWYTTNRPGGISYGDTLSGQARVKNPGDELVYVFIPREPTDAIIVNMHQPRPTGGVARDTMTMDEWYQRQPGTAPEVVLLQPVPWSDVTFVMDQSGAIIPGQ